MSQTENALLNFILRASDESAAGVSSFSSRMSGLASVGKTAMLGLGLAIAGAGGVVGALTLMGNKMADDTGEVRQLSRELGISAIQASQLRFTGERLGLSVDDMSRSFGLFEKKLVDSADKMAKLGVTAVETKDGHIDMNATLMQTADIFTKMPDGAEKTALALDLFGRSGKDLLPLLNKGSAGIKDLANEATRMGLVFDDKALAAAKRYTEAQKTMNEAWSGASNRLRLTFLPLIADASVAIAGFVDHFTPIVAANIESFGKKLDVAAGIARDMWAALHGQQTGGGDFLASIIGAESAGNVMQRLTDVGRGLADFKDNKLIPAIDWAKAHAPEAWAAVSSTLGDAWNNVIHPTLDFFIGRMEELKKKFDELPPEAKKVIEAAAAIGLANVALGDPIGSSIQNFSNLAQGIGAIASKGGMADKIIDKLGGIGVALGTAGLVGALAIAVIAWKDDWGQIQEKTEDATNKMGAFWRGFTKDVADPKPWTDLETNMENSRTRAINPWRTEVVNASQDLRNFGDDIEDHRAKVYNAEAALRAWEERGRKLGAAFQWLKDTVLAPIAGFLVDYLVRDIDMVIDAVQGFIDKVKSLWSWANLAYQALQKLIPGGGGGGNGPAPAPDFNAAGYQQYAEGGPVRRTGLALVHAGEFVVPAGGAAVHGGGGGGLRELVVRSPIALNGREIGEQVSRFVIDMYRDSGGVLEPV